VQDSLFYENWNGEWNANPICVKCDQTPGNNKMVFLGKEQGEGFEVEELYLSKSKYEILNYKEVDYCSRVCPFSSNLLVLKANTGKARGYIQIIIHQIYTNHNTNHTVHKSSRLRFHKTTKISTSLRIIAIRSALSLGRFHKH